MAAESEPDGPAEPGSARHRVVWQVADGGEAFFEKVLRNLRNVLADLQAEGVVVEVVAHGAGLPLVVSTGSPPERLADFQQSPVRFLACENAMAGQHVSQGELLGGVGTVASGLGHIVRRQSAGWSYLRG